MGLAAALVAVNTVASAAPYVPASDETVLALVSVTAEQRRMQSLLRIVTDDPANLDAALQLSRAWLDAGRRDGDPRFFSYVQGMLAPWTQRRDPPVEALILMATSLQSLHRFSEAMTLLDRALRIDPRNAQAWLSKATLLQVRGEFTAARAACAQLPGITDPRIGLACVASAQSMNGGLASSYESLLKLAANTERIDGAIRSWLLGQLGEMATRLDDSDAAERHFRAALLANPDDTYVKGELADLYLRESRPDEAMALLKGSEAQDAMLLRLAIAERQLGGTRWASLYEARYREALRGDDSTHLREHARYLLEVRADRTAALRAAERNWQVQREPADIRVYWQAAAAAHSNSLETIAQWIATNGYEDATLREGP